MEIVKKPDIRVFASEAKSGEVVSFPDVLRGWGVTLDQTQGKPPLEWMNDAFNRIDLNNLYLLQQGIPEWDKAVRYPINSIIKHADKLYFCVRENTNSTPTAGSSDWALYVKTASEKDAGIAKVATQAETDAGSNDTAIVTPKKLAANLKKLPTASLTQKGIVKLSSTLSDSETEAATPKAVKQVNDKAVINSDAINKIFSVGQSYVNVKAERAVGAIYTNNTDKPIFISICSGAINFRLNGSLSIFINNKLVYEVAFSDTNQTSTGGGRFSGFAFVGAGDTYSVEVNGAPLQLWMEYR